MIADDLPTTPSDWRFRRLRRDDFPLLAEWLAQPDVARWWMHEWTPAALERDFGPSVDGREPNEDWLALWHGRPVGLVQRSRVADYEENLRSFSAIGEVPPGSATLDYLVGTDRGRGLGAAMIAAMVQRTWHDLPEERLSAASPMRRASAGAIVVTRAGGGVLVTSWKVKVSGMGAGVTTSSSRR